MHISRSEGISVTADIVSQQELADWLVDKVARQLGVAPDSIDLDVPLADYGLDSTASLLLCADLEREKHIAVETTVVWDYATIDAIAGHLADAPRTAVPDTGDGVQGRAS
jgi:acyl carrier protein